MSDLIFKGQLKLSGVLKLAAESGKVKIEDNEILVTVDALTGIVQGKGIAVIQPPPPATPIDEMVDVKVINSFNSTLTIKVSGEDKPVVALGVCIQGGKIPGGTWPGMVLASTQNTDVSINGVAINVQNDNAITLPNGGNVTFNNSGQQ